MENGITSSTPAIWTTANTAMVAGWVQVAHGWKSTTAATGAAIRPAGGMKIPQAGTRNPSTCGLTASTTILVPMDICSNK